MSGTKFIKVSCAKCGEISEQLITDVKESSLGGSSYDSVMNRLQQCPKCGYMAKDISIDLNKELDNIDANLDSIEKDSEIEELKSKVAKYEKVLLEIQALLTRHGIVDILNNEKNKITKPITHENFTERKTVIRNNSAIDRFTQDVQIHRNKTTMEAEPKRAIKDNDKILPMDTNIDDILAISICYDEVDFVILHENGEVQIYKNYEENKKLDREEFEGLVKALKTIIKDWDNEYDEIEDKPKWRVSFDLGNKVFRYMGNDNHPQNWKYFEEFISILLTKFN